MPIDSSGSQKEKIKRPPERNELIRNVGHKKR
jgi:hypothetical protein